MKSRIFFFLFFSILPLLSCSDDDNNCIDDIEIANVVEVDAPATANVNETVTVNVTFNVRNGCGEFERFIESGSPTSRMIEVEARYEGCACTQQITPRTATYEFTPENTGAYLLQFRSGTNEFMEVTVTVEDVE